MKMETATLIRRQFALQIVDNGSIHLGASE